MTTPFQPSLYLLFVAACSGLLGYVGAGRAAAPADEADAMKEPPLELTLEHDGQMTAARLDEPTRIKTATGVVELTVRMKPTRVFRTPGVTFEYPAYYAWEADSAVGVNATWTMSGNDTMLQLTKYGNAELGKTVLKPIVEGMCEMYGEENAEMEEVSLVIGNRSFDGYLIRVELAGSILTQHVVSFAAGDSSYTIVLQDSLDDDEESSAEYVALLELLGRTLEIEGNGGK